MDYLMQNSETGEIDYEPSDFDRETGEPLIRRNGFHIPRKYLKGTGCEEFDQEMTGDYRETFQPKGIHVQPQTEQHQQFSPDDYVNMDGVKKDIILRYKKPNFRLFLLPTLVFFNVYCALFLSLIEMMLHYWAHFKNGLNCNKEVYFRSPLHVLTSQFCAVCRAENEMDIQVFKMLNKQMRQASQSKTLKGVTKVIS